MSRHTEASYHGALCHNMSYVRTIVASLMYNYKWPGFHKKAR